MAMVKNSDDKIKLDKDFVINKVQHIVNKKHSIPAKRQIKIAHDRVNFACPICGDSEKIASRKRGNVYLKNMMYKCFNCGYYTSFIKLCDTFNESIDVEKRLEIYQYIDENTHFNKDDDEFVIKSLDKLINIDDLISGFNNPAKNKLTDIRPIQKGSMIYEYLTKKRKIFNNSNLYEGLYHFTEKWVEPVVVILNRHNDLVLGLQVRNLKEQKNKRFYKIYDFETIYNTLNPETPLDEFEAHSYNKLSHFFNVLNINFERPVTLFEGYFDSIFFPNSIGSIGINTDFSFLLNDDSLNIRFFYDNDKDGYRKSKQRLEEGYPVFLWKKLFKDILKNKNNKYKAQIRLNKIKDLNKLAIEMKRSPYKYLNLENYFSNDKLDLIYLDQNIQIISLL